MATYNTPGVYVEEVSSLPGSITPVPTAIPAFIGYTETDPGTTPVKIRSLAEYVSTFGGPEAAISVNLPAFTPGTTVISAPANFSYFLMYYSIQHYFQNGGGPCYVVSIGDYDASPATADYTPAFAALKLEDEPTILVLPDATLLGTTALQGSVYTTALQHCTEMKDRFLVMDPHSSTYNNSATTASALRGNVVATASNDLGYGAAYHPWVLTSIQFPESAVEISAGVYANKTLAWALDQVANGATPSDNLLERAGAIMEQVRTFSIILPPSGAVTGAYCATDRNRGVWKAPANVALAGVIGPVERLTDDENASLNIDSVSGKSINAIREFPGKGTLIWGARTMRGNDNEWKYVPVRRLFMMMEESIGQAMEAMIFEPNDATTWNRVKGMTENFLNDLWQQGALAGAKPEHAYYVKVGLGQTMDENDLLEGRLIVEIGAAAVRPAEFIILRFSHMLQSS